MRLKAAVSVGLLATVHGLSDDYDPVNSEFLQSVNNVLNPTPAPSATCSDLSGCDSTDFRYTLTMLNFPAADPLEDVSILCSNDNSSILPNGVVALAGTCAVPFTLRCNPDECGGNIVVNICCPQSHPCLFWELTSAQSASVFVAINPPVPLTSTLPECASGPGNTVNCVGNPLSSPFSVHCPANTDAPTESPTPQPTLAPVPLPTQF